MRQCLDQLTIQALTDGEEQDPGLLEHIRRCPDCNYHYSRQSALVKMADRLKSDAKLPAAFYWSLERKLKTAPFPAALVSAAVILLTLVSLALLGPAYFEWWLSVGLTRQVGVILDLFLGLLTIGNLVDPVWWIIGLAALVAFELVLLNMLRNMEGRQNA